ncbi:MAG TPA: response regulator transcription factor, partial [Acidimicrobiales bacterium]|nr:response regulator transcription factor [Acidimicrobiales bacterium]
FYPGMVSTGAPQAGRIVVVDDAQAVRVLLTRYLEMEGFQVHQVPDGGTALATIAASQPDLVLLDLNLPSADGLDILTRLRRDSEVPVILLTARGSEADRILGLKLGADDYVVKPFSLGELTARIASVLRRTRSTAPQSVLQFDGLVLDLGTREVTAGDLLVTTTAREFDLLAFLAASPRQVFSRQQLLANVWDSSEEWQDPDTVTEHIRRIRRRIEPDPDHPRWIKTVRGVGYRFDP